MTTKRRKAWVTFDQLGPGGAYRHKSDAAARVKWASGLTDAKLHEVAVSMVELRRGDVVLTADQRRTLATVVKWMDDESAGKIKVLVEDDLRALLRGGK